MCILILLYLRFVREIVDHSYSHLYLFNEAQGVVNVRGGKSANYAQNKPTNTLPLHFANIYATRLMFTLGTFCTSFGPTT